MSIDLIESTHSHEAGDWKEPSAPDTRALQFVVESLLPLDLATLRTLPEDAWYDYVCKRLYNEGYDVDAVLLEAGVIFERGNHEV